MSISSYISKHSFLASMTIIVIIILVIIIGRRAGGSPVVATNTSVKKVNVVDVATFREGSDIVTANGIVESRGQADLKSQMSASVAVIHGNIGDTVYAGQTILELENSDIRAQLNQVKAALALAEGQYYTGGVSLDSAKSGAVDKVRDAYLKGYEATYTQIEPLLFNSDGNSTRLSSYIADRKINDNIIDIWIDLTTIFREWKITVDSLSVNSSPETLVSAIKLSSKNLIVIDNLLSNISLGLNDAAKYATPTFATFLNTWKVVVSGARASISGAGQALTGAEATLSAANASYGMTAPAQVSAAKASVSSLEIQLGKTIIRSPINGKIAGLPLGVGELATPGQLLATVVGESGLEVKAFASGEDITRIKVGASVTIQGKFQGKVESVAPSVSSTNRKVEVIISVNGPATDSSVDTKFISQENSNQDSSDLVIGQNVQVSIKVLNGNSGISTPKSQKNTYILPIQDVKIVPGDAYVFTVDSDSKIKRHPVTLGEVRGDFIEVVAGITEGMKIVSPVYELDEGESVSTE